MSIQVIEKDGRVSFDIEEGRIFDVEIPNDLLRIWGIPRDSSVTLRADSEANGFMIEWRGQVFAFINPPEEIFDLHDRFYAAKEYTSNRIS